MFSLVEKCSLTTRAWNAACVEFDEKFREGDPFGEDDPDTYPVKNALLYCCGMIHSSDRYDFSLDVKDIQISLPVRYEMYMLLDQLGSLLSFLRNDRDLAEIDFFEQGYTFQVYLSRTSNIVDIRVREPPKIRTVQVDQKEITESISRFLLSFLAAVADVVPSVLKEPAFEKWFMEMFLPLKCGPRS